MPSLSPSHSIPTASVDTVTPNLTSSKSITTVLHLFTTKITVQFSVANFNAENLHRETRNALNIPQDIPIAVFRNSKSENAYTYISSPESYAKLTRAIRAKTRAKLMVVPLRPFLYTPPPGSSTIENPIALSPRKTEHSAVAAVGSSKTAGDLSKINTLPQHADFKSKAQQSTIDIKVLKKSIVSKDCMDAIRKSLISSKDFLTEISKELQSSKSAQNADKPNDTTNLSSSSPSKELNNFKKFCDYCDCAIYGGRFKCLDCPDFDYCESCHSNAVNHESIDKHISCHSFVRVRSWSDYFLVKKDVISHPNIFCDGKSCENSLSCIEGVRYKCLVCNDFDLCSSCEALPENAHNPSHPMIKYKMPASKTCPFNVTVGDYVGSLKLKTANVVAAAVSAANAAANAAADVSFKPPNNTTSTLDSLFVSKSTLVETSPNSNVSIPELSVEPEIFTDAAVQPKNIKITGSVSTITELGVENGFHRFILSVTNSSSVEWPVNTILGVTCDGSSITKVGHTIDITEHNQSACFIVSIPDTVELKNIQYSLVVGEQKYPVDASLAETKHMVPFVEDDSKHNISSLSVSPLFKAKVSPSSSLDSSQVVLPKIFFEPSLPSTDINETTENPAETTSNEEQILESNSELSRSSTQTSFESNALYEPSLTVDAGEDVYDFSDSYDSEYELV